MLLAVGNSGVCVRPLRLAGWVEANPSGDHTPPNSGPPATLRGFLHSAVGNSRTPYDKKSLMGCGEENTALTQSSASRPRLRGSARTGQWLMTDVRETSPGNRTSLETRASQKPWIAYG